MLINLKNKEKKMKIENYKKMVELQHSFNILAMGENYLDLNLNWNSAIIAESGEMLDSLGYKWWKKQEVDMDNAKVEAIDLLHFVISERMQSYNHSEFDTIIETSRDFSVFNSKVFKNGFFLYGEDIKNNINTLNYDKIDRFMVLKEIFNKLEMSNEDVYIAYIVKNCLNKFRQNNGYKEGTYQKIWIDKEDNVVAYELAKNIGADENLFDLLYDELETTYSYYFKSGVKK
jgi:dimeric dUTPase (all-alpha-NTP-PPase superfamily)